MSENIKLGLSNVLPVVSARGRCYQVIWSLPKTNGDA